MNKKIADSVLDSFRKNYNTSPNLYYSPGRINLIGEHIDYNDGFVLPAAINKGIYYAVAANTSGKINITALDFHESIAIDFNEVKPSGSWRNYVLSVINEFLLLKKDIKGIDCVFCGDIPIGSGMSSSAAVEGGLAFAINEIYKTGLNRKELALLGQRAEQNFPNMQCGIMDQYANMNGKKDHVILLDCKTVEHQYFPLSLPRHYIVMVNSKVHHELVSGEYNLRRKYCEEGMRILKSKTGTTSFRDADIKEKLGICKEEMSVEVYNCCKYVTEEIARTKDAVKLLEANDLAGFGKLMNATHEGLSKLYKVSCKELDFLAEYAHGRKEVVGSRMMGGGFGGCTINIVEKDTAEQFVADISAAYQKQFGISTEAYVVETSDGTGQISI